MTSESGRRDPASLYSPPINLVERRQVYIRAGKWGQRSDKRAVCVGEQLCGRRGRFSVSAGR